MPVKHRKKEQISSNDNKLYPKLNVDENNVNQEEDDSNNDSTEDDFEMIERSETESPTRRPYTRSQRRLDQMRETVFDYRPSEVKETIRTKTPAIKRAPKKAPDNNNSFYCIIIIFIALLLCAFSVSFIVFHQNSNNFLFSSPTVSFVDPLQVFDTQIHSLLTKYNKVLPDFSKRVMKSAVRRMMQNENSLGSNLPEPAVILFIGYKEEDQIDVAKCIANDYIRIISNAYNESDPIKIIGSQTSWADIEQKFKINFEDDAKHSIIIEDLEQIPGEQIQVLHQFTDHSNAKYPQSIIILTANNYKRISVTQKAEPREMDEVATQLLEFSWKNSLKEDKRGALISRLTPSVVIILEDKLGEIEC